MYIYLVTSYDKQDNPDFIADFTLFILWSEIEANVAMLVCCMPTMGPVMGSIHKGAAYHLRAAMPNSWTRFSNERATTNKDTETGVQLHGVSDAWLRSPPPTYYGTNWLGGGSSITAAGYSSMEDNWSDCERGGILTRTEISRTLEPKAGMAL